MNWPVTVLGLAAIAIGIAYLVLRRRRRAG